MENVRGSPLQPLPTAAGHQSTPGARIISPRQEQEQEQDQPELEMLRVLPLVTTPDQRVAVSRCPIKPQLLSTWLITAPASCSQPEQSTVASSQFRDITFQTVSSVSSSYLLPPAVCRVHTVHWVHYLYLSLPVVRSSAPLHHWSWSPPSAALYTGDNLNI